MSAKECAFYLNMWSYVAVRQERHVCVFFFFNRIAYALLTCIVDDDGENGDPMVHMSHTAATGKGTTWLLIHELLRMLSSVTLRRAP